MELELMFHGRRIEGIVDGTIPFFMDNMVRNTYREDKRRLQMIQTIMTAHKTVPEEQMESFFDEILVKGIVKTDMSEGMMIPAPSKTQEDSFRSWYRVKRKILTGYGKNGYHLEDCETGDNSSNKKDLLIYRSTASCPGHIDAASTVITDINPLHPPGYKWRHVGKNIENQIIHDNPKRTLKIIGHSLGGSHAQLLIMNRIKEKSKDVFKRAIEVVTFDAPKLRRRDAVRFAHWMEKEGNEDAKKMSIIHFVSRGDVAPLIGEASLGWYGNTKKLKDFKIFKLSPLNNSPAQSTLLPNAKR
jgi:hypothetical protein